MPLPTPEPGLIVRYDYVWHPGGTDRPSGAASGKDRPACLVAVVKEASRTHVVLLPITHAPPRPDTVAVEIPPKVKRHLGLDDDRSWVILSQYNADNWPSPGLSQRADKPGVFAYGLLPPSFFERIRVEFRSLLRLGKSRRVDRGT